MQQGQRIVVAMVDGFGMDCFEASPIPFMKAIAEKGLFSRVAGMFPSVTNTNNVSIITGVWPLLHGVTANSLYDRAGKRSVYANDPSAIASPTLFERAASAGVDSVLLTCKRKTKELMNGKVGYALAAENLSAAETDKYGSAPEIYSREINYWLWETAGRILRDSPEIGVIYVHTTDYPMHRWAPGEPESREHMATIDAIMARIARDHPDVAFFISADHGMNAKTQCWDLAKACANRGRAIEYALSPDRDYYVQHHNNFTGCSWVWLASPDDRDEVIAILRGLRGVEEVRDSSEVAAYYNTNPDHLGDLVVFGDRDTMFGEMEAEYGALPLTYRSHGSLHEMDLPLIIYNWQGMLPPADSFRYNKDLTAFLFADGLPSNREGA